jgi:multidrug resistance protein, MATE family
MESKFQKIMQTGDSLKDILLYWLPETISNLMLVSLPPIIDSYLIANLQSTNTYGALAMANNFLHLLIKIAEAIPVATIAIVGRHNGAQEYGKCGKDLGDTFWTTTLIGFFLFIAVFSLSGFVFSLLGVPAKMIYHGVPFLRLKSFGIFLIFMSLGFFAFMRGVKNTKTPMIIFMIGMATFIVVDYTLVLGKFGFPALGLTGSAIATIIQYSVIILISIAYILWNPDYKKYFSEIFFRVFNFKGALHLLNLSWPIMLDKASLSASYIFLSGYLAHMGKYAIASFGMIKDLERFAILPAVGFSQIIIFLVSNKLGAQDPEGAKGNIKKVLILTSIMLCITLGILCINARYFISFFDPKNKVSDFAVPALVGISLLVVFDFVQLVLAGALRGAGDVKTVMWARILCFGGFFLPLGYFLTRLPIQNQVLKFTMIYGSFYVTTGLVGIIFLLRIKTNKWQKKQI